MPRRIVALLFTLFVLALGTELRAQTLATLPDLGLMEAHGTVSTVVVQPDGKVLIAGGFEMVNGVPRSGLVRLNADGTLDDTWNPAPNFGVTAIAVDGSVVYVGGSFTSIGGAARNRLAALDIVTGNATAWNPDADGSVSTIAVAGGTVYVGGGFHEVGGQSRNRIAALDPTTGNATAWNPNASGPFFGGSNLVRAIVVSGSTVYVGGAFNAIGGQARSRIAALDAATGNATAWNPNATGGSGSNAVEALVLAGSTLYVAGSFAAIGGQSRANLAALDVTTGNATAWNPSPTPASQTVAALARAGGVVYVGGQFTAVGGQARSFVAALDETTGAATAWNPAADGDVRALAVAAGTVHVGGSFGTIGGGTGLLFARLDAGTGAHVTGFRPAAGYASSVRRLARRGDGKIVVTGDFRMAGKAGAPRFGILRLDADGSLDPDWNPVPNHQVDDVAVSGTTTFVGGRFTAIGGVVRNRVAALDDDGNVTPFVASSSQPVPTIALDGATLYASGTFDVGGSERNLVALDATTGTPTAWTPEIDANASELAVANGRVYAAGAFIAGEAVRLGLAAFDQSTGALTDWNPGADGPVNDIEIANGVVYVAGDFTTAGGAARNRVAALDPVTGAATAWNPDADGAVIDLAVDGGTVYAGGSFTAIGGQPRAGAAALDALTGAATTWDPALSGRHWFNDLAAQALLPAAGGVHVGGFFARALGAERAALAAVTGSTGGGLAAGTSVGRLDFLPRDLATTSPALTVTFRNFGAVPLALGVIGVTGDFAAAADCGATLAAGASCTVDVTFTPTAAGFRTGTLTIGSDAPNAPHEVALGGFGIDAGLCCELSVDGCGVETSTTTSATSHTTSFRIDLPPPTPTATGPSVLVGAVLAGRQESRTTTIAIGPGTILVGVDQQLTCFIPSGTRNLNENVHTETFILEYYQPTEVPPLDPFLCYKTAAAKAPKGTAPFPKFAPTSLSAVDALASRQLDLKKPLVVCNPADRNGADPTAPTHPAHLEGYAAKLTKTSPPQAKPAKTVLGITNPIGALQLEVKGPDRLLVPSAQALGSGGVPPLGATTVDHFACFKAKVAKAKKGEPPFPVFTKTSVTVTDEFGGPLVFDLKKPTRLCLPADANAEAPGAENHPDRLVCYAAKLAKQTPAQPKYVAQVVSTANRFGAEVVRAKKVDELCLPSVALAP